MRTRLRPPTAATWLAAVQGIIGFEWLHAGWDKIRDAGYVAGMPKTLHTFSGKNPTGWYRDFLLGAPTDHPTVFAYLVSYGELVVGIALLGSAAVLLFRLARRVEVGVRLTAVAALVGGIFFNLNFWLAAGWMSVSTDSLNVLMGLVQVTLVVSEVAALLALAVRRRVRLAATAAPRARRTSVAA